MNRVTFAGVLAIVAGSAAYATPINYGNFAGTNVSFQQVQEDSTTDPTPLFGAPVVSVDTLAFTHMTFGSSSSNGSVDITDGTLSFFITANPGANIPKVRFNEQGDYSLVGALGTSLTGASVAASIFVTVLEVNGVAINPLHINGNLAFSPSSGNYHLPVNAGLNQIWTGTGLIDVDAFLALNGGGHATKVAVTLDNTLVTTSESGTISFIKKKEVDGMVIDVIPAPGAIALLGLGGLVATRRRR